LGRPDINHRADIGLETNTLPGIPIKEVVQGNTHRCHERLAEVRPNKALRYGTLNATGDENG
jgi:hypothetical protein